MQTSPDQGGTGAVQRLTPLPVDGVLVEHCSTSNAGALSAALCLCCVCLCELLKNQEKQKAEGEERKRQSFSAPPLPISSFYFLFSSLVSSFSSADLANRPIELLFLCHFILSGRVVFYLSSPALILHFPLTPLFFCFIQSDSFFFFSLSDLVFFVTDTHTGLGNCGGQ